MKKNVFALCAIFSASCGVLFASVSSNEIPQVVVYASRIEIPRASMPATVRILDSDAIRQSAARDVPELLRKKANLDIRTLNSNPLQSEIAMRGFGEKSYGRVKVLLDGEELNNVDMAVQNLTRISLDSIDRIEVIYGPSPVLYGDGAVAGVINIMTDSNEGGEVTSIAARAGSQNTYGANFRTKGVFEEEEVRYTADYDFGMSDGYRDRSAWRIHGANAALRKSFENGSRIGVSMNYGNSFYEMPGALTLRKWKSGRKSAAYRDDWGRLWNCGVGVDSKLWLGDEQWLYFDGRFSAQHRTANWGDYHYANEYDLYGVFISPRYINEKELFGSENRFTLGADLRFDRYNVEDNSGFNNPEYHFERFRGALFAHDEFSPVEKFSFTAGARFEGIGNRWVDYAGVGESGGSFWEGDFELGAVYRPVRDMKSYVKITRFHRSPFCDEMNYTENGELLKPERGWSADIGVEYSFLEEFKALLAGYASIIDDEIFYNPYARDYGGGAWGGYNCNSPGRTRRLGVDAGFSWRREKVASLAVMYGFVDAAFVDGQYEGKQVPLTPVDRVRVSGSLWLGSEIELSGGFRYAGVQYLSGDFNNGHDRLPGSVLFDMALKYEPDWAENLTLTFVMDNLFDRDYCDFAGWSDYGGAYYYPACGRSFMFTARYEF